MMSHWQRVGVNQDTFSGANASFPYEYISHWVRLPLKWNSLDTEWTSVDRFQLASLVTRLPIGYLNYISICGNVQFPPAPVTTLIKYNLPLRLPRTSQRSMESRHPSAEICAGLLSQRVFDPYLFVTSSRFISLFFAIDQMWFNEPFSEFQDPFWGSSDLYILCSFPEKETPIAFDWEDLDHGENTEWASSPLHFNFIGHFLGGLWRPDGVGYFLWRDPGSALVLRQSIWRKRQVNCMFLMSPYLS